ncbi:hypothetical protein J4211_03065 [Candidatus Woesearchaeota archaeon]|nr:hypothetical protein [Candidatus Woesearchaeota archaeon]
MKLLLLFGLVFLVSCVTSNQMNDCQGQVITYESIPQRLLLDNFLDFGYFANFSVCAEAINEQLTDYSIKKTEAKYWWTYKGSTYQYFIERPYGSTNEYISRIHKLLITPTSAKALRQEYTFLSCKNFSVMNPASFPADKWYVWVSEQDRGLEVGIRADKLTGKEPTSQDLHTFSKEIINCTIPLPASFPSEPEPIIEDDREYCRTHICLQ